MDQITHNYIKSQLKRLDTLFDSCPTSKPFCIELNRIFKDTFGQINELNTQITAFEKELESTSIADLKRRIKSEQEINQKFESLLENNKIKINQIRQDIHSREKMFSDDINKQLHSLFIRQKEFNRSINADIRRLNTENTDKEKTLSHEQQSQKNEYLSKINRLYDQQTSNFYRINLSYHEAIKNLHQKNLVRLQKIKDIVDNLDTLKENYLTFHQNDLIYVKQNFHRISILLNEKINEIQSAYKSVYQLTEQELKEKQKEIESELSRISTENVKSNRLILDSFQDDLIKIDQRLDRLKSIYENKLASLTHIYQKDVTQINVSRQNEKELYATKLNALNHEYDEESLEFKDDEVKQKILKKNYDLKFKDLEKEFSTLQENFDRSLKLRKKRYLQNRYNLGVDYIKKQELYRSDRLIKDQKKDLYLKLNRDSFHYHEIYMTKLNHLFNLEKDMKNKIIDSGMRIEAIPLDIQILLARHIHDSEINYLNLEQNYTVADHERKTSEANAESNHEALLLKLERDRLNLIQKFEVQQNELDNYLSMEYEKNITEGKRKVLEAQKAQNRAHLEIQLTLKKHTKEIETEKHNTEVERLRALRRIAIEKLGLSEAYQKQDIFFNNNAFKLVTQRDLGVLMANDTIKKSELENTKAQKVLSSYFEMLIRVQSEINEIALSIKDVYQTSDFPTYKEILKAFQSIVIGQKEYKNQVINEIKNNMANKIQNKIDELTLSKYEQEYTTLINNYDKDKKVITDQKDALNEQIRSYRNQATNLYQAIAILQNKNDLITKTISVVGAQIKNLKSDNKNKQNRKTARNLTLALTTHKKEIAKNNQEINHLRLQIRQINKRISFSDKGHRPLEIQLAELEYKRKLDEQILNQKKYQEGKIYFDSLTLLDSSAKRYQIAVDLFTVQATQLMQKMRSSKINPHQFKKYYKRLTKLITHHNQINSKTHKEISELLIAQLNAVKHDQDNVINAFHKNYDKSYSHLTASHQNEHQKILKNQNQLNKYQKSLIRLTDKRLKNSLDILKAKQKSELKTAHQKHQEAIDYRKTIKQQANEILIASEENRKQVLLNQQLTLKAETKQFELNKRTLITDSLNALETIRKNILDQDNLYHHQLTQYAHQDRQYRSKLNTQLHTRRTYQESTIDKLNKEITQIRIDVTKNENQTHKKIEKLVKKTTKAKERKIKKEKQSLIRTIFRQNQKFKQQLKQEENTYL